MCAVRAVNVGYEISAGSSKPAAFISTKVSKFSGVTSWDQYRQVFDTSVRSNVWDDIMVALQLLSHLEGETLNVG